MELKSTLDYKGYTIKTFATPGKNLIKIYLGEDPIDYNSEIDEQYEGYNTPHIRDQKAGLLS
jgi:hypothetical protein